jgi:hypothetical protein
MRKSLFRALLFLTIPLSLLVAYLLMEVVRRYLLEPMIFAFRIERLIYEALPQALWWGLFIAVLVIIALRSMRLQPVSFTRKPPKPEQRPSRAQAWRRLVAGTSRGTYNRWLLAREIADLTVRVIAHQERISVGQARNRLKSGSIQVPPEIQEYVEMGLDAPSFRQYTDFLAYMRSSRGSAPLELDPEIIIAYLEDNVNLGGPS